MTGKTYFLISLLCFFYFCWLLSLEEWKNKLVPLSVGLICAILWPITLILSIGYAIIKRRGKEND